MSQTTILFIIVVVAVIAAIAFFALRGRGPEAVAVAADADDDPAMSASGEAMIIGDVMPIDSNEPGIPPGTAQPPPRPAPHMSSPAADPPTPNKPSQAADSPTPRKPAQVYEARREPMSSREPVVPIRQSDPPLRQADASTGSGEGSVAPRDIRWAKRFAPPDGAFDDATRLNLIRDLGIVRAPWGVPLLTQAYEEEPAIEHRRAALRALAAYRHPDTQPTFDLALHGDDEESRAIAANVLTALSIRAALPS